MVRNKEQTQEAQPKQAPSDRAWAIAHAYGRGFPDADLAALAAYLEVAIAGKHVREIANRFVAAEPYGIGQSRYTLIRLLYLAREKSLSHSTLAMQLGSTQGNVTQLVDGLVNDGLVARVAAPNGRRSTHVRLTPAGMAKAEQVVPAMVDFMERCCSALTEEETVVLKQLLTKFRAGLSAIDRDLHGGVGLSALSFPAAE